MSFTLPRWSRAERAPEPRALDRRGYYRSPVTLSEYRRGKPAPNKGMRLPAEPLSQREVLALLATCGRGPAGLRDAAIIVTMWRAGLRVAETLALRVKDVDLEQGAIRVLHGKGDRARTVGLDRMACSVIGQWVEHRRKLGIDGRHPLFCVISEPTIGQAMHTGGVRDMLKRRALRAGIEKRVHPHGLRHTHAFELMEEGFPIGYIQRQLGHASLSVTARYVDHLNPHAVMEKVRARAWPGEPQASGDQRSAGEAPRSSAADRTPHLR